MRADEIAGYVYRADIYTPLGLAATMGLPGEHVRPHHVETFLDILASERGIDRGDEWTFDSGDFPKIVFADSFYDVLYSDPDATVVDAEFGSRGTRTCHVLVRDLL